MCCVPAHVQKGGGRFSQTLHAMSDLSHAWCDAQGRTGQDDEDAQEVEHIPNQAKDIHGVGVVRGADAVRE